MEERGVLLDHTTVQRWVITDSPRRVQQMSRPMLGCKAFDAAQGTLSQIGRMRT